MKSIFLVWKDKNCNGENPEWIHMTAKEFFEFKHKPENSERKFVQVDDKNLSSKYSVIFIEANKELYKKCNAEHSEDMRRKEEKKKYPRKFVSLDKLLAVSGAQAEEESISISKNMIWSINRRMKNGTYLASHTPVSYTHLISAALYLTVRKRCVKLTKKIKCLLKNAEI